MGTCVSSCFISQKANDKFFWSFLFPTFLFFGDQINLTTTFRMSHLWPFSVRKVHYEIRSLVLYIPTEKWSLLGISETSHTSVFSNRHIGQEQLPVPTLM